LALLCPHCKYKKFPARARREFQIAIFYELRSTSLAVQVLVVPFVLAALLLFSILSLLLAALSGLIFVALLTGLAALLARLSRLSTTLTVSFHIICHKQSSQLMRYWAHARFNSCFNLVAAATLRVGR
jgi:hypothetical protein